MPSPPAIRARRNEHPSRSPFHHRQRTGGMATRHPVSFRIRMRTSKLFARTLREAPAEAEVASHRLLLRAAYIRKLVAGVYTWLPLGFRTLRKIEAIIRDEMDRAGAQEIR